MRCGFYIKKKETIPIESGATQEWKNRWNFVPLKEKSSAKKERWGNLPCHEAKGKSTTDH